MKLDCQMSMWKAARHADYHSNTSSEKGQHRWLYPRAQEEMLRELRERLQHLMQSTATQGSLSQAQEAAMASLKAANEDLRRELQSLKADRDEVTPQLSL